MELALARLVGAGLTLVFEGFEEAVPPGAVENGLRLIQYIAKHRPDVVVSLTEGVVTDIWTEWRQAKLPAEVAIAHIEALPDIMDRCRCSDGMMLGAVAAIQVARRMGSAARPVSHSARVATAIIGRALETDEFASRGLNDSIAFFFLDRLLARLMPDQQLFLDLRPVFLAYLDSGAWRTPMPASDAASSFAADTPVETPRQQAEHPEQSSEAEQATQEVASPHEPIADAVIDTSARIAAALYDNSELEPETAFTAHPQSAHDLAITQVTVKIECETPTEQPDVTPYIARVAELAQAPAIVLSYLADRVRSRLGHLNEETLEDLAVGLRDILVRLAEPTDPDPVAADLQRQAATAIASCDFIDADRLLGQSEDIHLLAAPIEIASAHVHLVEAARTRACRAQLEELSGEFRRAARHYAAAARCLGENDRKGRRNLLMRQAGALVAQGELRGETASLAEAAQIYADAGRLLSEQDAPLDWAIAHLELGRILMELGERERRPERYLAAALHFKPACDVFSRLKQAENWARAQLGIADALRSQGEVQGDIVTLSEAAFSYRAALGIATRDRMPPEWALSTFRLATTLLRIDDELGDMTHHEEAAMGLRAVLAAEIGVPHTVRCGAQAKLAQTLLAIGRARGEDCLEDEAIAVLRATRDAADRNLSGSVRAHHDDHVGSLLHQIGDARGNAGLLTEATELKLAALDYFQAQGPGETADRVRSELSTLERSVAQITRAVAETVAA